jgi:hypothetical protein
MATKKASAIKALRDCPIDRADVNARFQISSKPLMRSFMDYREDVSVYEFRSFKSLRCFMLNKRN